MSDRYNNRSLFSDYYLEELLRDDPHWQAAHANAWEIRQRIANIWERAKPGIEDVREAEVERRFIRPVLDVLGHVYEVQPGVRSPEGTKTPDYAFFATADERNEASQRDIDDYWKTTLAVGDAKAWERSLDKRLKGPGDPFTNHNPSYQIDFYLRAADRRWGILTNGRHWRLYHRDLSYRLDVYYEVDLPSLLAADDDAFTYFLAFFSQSAFLPNASGQSFLDGAYAESTRYAAGLSDELKDNVYEALRLLAQGFLSYPGNELQPQDLDVIRENAFVVIYRLLFVFYAEAREFLPVTNAIYRDTYSLQALAHEVETKEPFESSLSPTAPRYWSRLTELFRLVNDGDEFLGIPPYNGGLFDDQRHPLLTRWRIGDRYLAAAIDQLARAKAAGRTGRGFVSYRDLGIRELGSIYECLLEHRPRYATVDLAVIRQKGAERFIQSAELGRRRAVRTYPVGSVYLETDKGERKATGSYYTPQYIVEYIVKNTLGPLIEELKASDEDMIDGILSLKVLDPAMGSGHFLVEATDFLARALVEALGGDPREFEEEGEEIRWARREVVERCIYGVDLNPLAVELAKLSLWLSTVALDKPLNFLDHHLRCGNSLIGARLDDLGILPEVSRRRRKAEQQPITTLAGHRFQHAIASAVGTFQQIAAAPSDSPEDIHRKESAYETARYALSRIEAIADVWTSVYFGNEIKDKDAYEGLMALAEGGDADWPQPGELRWLDEAKAAAEERRFFHWELEFPEVFFDGNGQPLPNAGFGVVVGNPPYVTTLSREERDYFFERSQTRGRELDTFYLFSERGIDLTRIGGMVSLIVPNVFLLQYEAETFRRFLLKYAILSLADLGFTVFGEAVVPSAVFVVQKAETEDNLVNIYEDGDLEAISKEIGQSVFKGLPYGQFNIYLSPETVQLRRRLWVSSVPLREVAETHEGVHSGNIRSKLFNRRGELPSSRKMLKGSDIDRYSLDWGGWFVNYDPSLIERGRGEYASLREERLFTESKVLTRQTADRIIATYDDCSFYTDNTLHSTQLLPQSSLSWHYLLSLLNSNLLTFVYRQETQEQGRTLPQVKIVFLQRLPIRRINFTTPEAERERLVAEAKRLYHEGLRKVGLAGRSDENDSFRS